MIWPEDLKNNKKILSQIWQTDVIKIIKTAWISRRDNSTLIARRRMRTSRVSYWKNIRTSPKIWNKLWSNNATMRRMNLRTIRKLNVRRRPVTSLKNWILNTEINSKLKKMIKEPSAENYLRKLVSPWNSNVPKRRTSSKLTNWRNATSRRESFLMNYPLSARINQRLPQTNIRSNPSS